MWTLSWERKMEEQECLKTGYVIQHYNNGDTGSLRITKMGVIWSMYGHFGY